MIDTLKEVKQFFAEELYSGLNENDLDSKEEYNNLFKRYIESLDEFNPEGEEENLCWEAGYIRGYEVALKGILHEIESSNNKLITADRINYLLTN